MNYFHKKMGIENLGVENVQQIEVSRQGFNAAERVQRYMQRGFKIMRSLYKFLYRTTLRAIAQILEIATILWLTCYYIAEAAVLNLTPQSLRTLKSLRGRVILVTGGAGGVGQELVLRLARYKAKVIVWDVNEKAMAKLKDKCAAEGYRIYTYTVDLSDRQSIYKTAEAVKDDLGTIDILINNAGIVCGQTFMDLPDYMIEKTYKVNTLSCYWTVKAFLPDMIKQGRGHIATVSSLTGLLGTYNCTDYSGSKYATIGFHESLMAELKTMGFHKIHLTMVSPYFINTGMFEGCKPTCAPMLEPKEVAKRIILAIRKEEVFCTVPASSNYILALKHYLPSKLNWLYQTRVIGLPQAMKTMRKFNEVVAA
ncbi:short-chain dehydrogenase/reductase family 16C member 6 [Euwallacea similis]|uniref:short-chain dehydrogenase/reductase family 16C member 6 n=1 Tax=Euwallacea similis TaxID=1736056 RepID=UPI00344DBE31